MCPVHGFVNEERCDAYLGEGPYDAARKVNLHACTDLAKRLPPCAICGATTYPRGDIAWQLECRKCGQVYHRADLEGYWRIKVYLDDLDRKEATR